MLGIPRKAPVLHGMHGMSQPETHLLGIHICLHCTTGWRRMPGRKLCSFRYSRAVPFHIRWMQRRRNRPSLQRGGRVVWLSVLVSIRCLSTNAHSLPC